MFEQHRSFWIRKKVPDFVGVGYKNHYKHWEGQEMLFAGLLFINHITVQGYTKGGDSNGPDQQNS